MENDKLYAQIQDFVAKDATDIANKVYEERATKYGVADVPFHVHNNIDAPAVPMQNLAQKTFYIHWTLPGSSAATSGNYGTFWIAPFACVVLAVYEYHETAGTAGGDVTLLVKKGSAPSVSITTFDLKAADDTTYSGTINTAESGGIRINTLQAEDTLWLDTSGTLTDVNNVTVVVVVQY